MTPSSGSIEYDGHVYDSWADLPQEARDLIGSTMPDTNGDGIPDIFQGGPAPASVTTTRVTVNDTTYDSLDEVPPGLRAHLERAMAADLAPGETVTERVEGQPVEQPRRPWWRRFLG